MSIKNAEKLVNALGERAFHYFGEISKIPRCSGNEKAAADYLEAFGARLGFAARRSGAVINGKQTHNVVLRKPASKGYEGLTPVILQAHIDMVGQKTKDSAHNFMTDPIKLIIEGDTMRADKTTLGADDGIGAAIILAILESGELAHPPIEALFTSDEEDGMTGAAALDRSFITGTRLINLDAEAEGTLYCGCAGGADAYIYLPIAKEPVPEGFCGVQLELSGLLGGHSGLEIHKKRANAHKLMARALCAIQSAYPMRLIAFTGGDRRNVIAREAGALFAVEAKDRDNAIALAEAQGIIYAREYENIEPSIALTAKPIPSIPSPALSRDSAIKLLSAITIMPNGIQAMHGKVEGLVETSCNLGVIRQEDDQFVLCSLVRSFYETKKLYVLSRMQKLAELLGARFAASGGYPGWEPNPDSDLLARFTHAYRSAFGKEPGLESVHAGLECGYFADKFPGMDMISCGPTITGAHTPEEMLYISSTEKVIKLLLNVLNQMGASS